MASDGSGLDLITEKRPVPLNPDLDIVRAVNAVKVTPPRISVSAIEWAWRFGAGGGVPNVGLGATTDQSNFPQSDPRSLTHNNQTFIRSTLQLGTRTPQIMVDAAGRYAINGGLYVMPSAFDRSGNLIINTDESSRVAYTGLHGTIFGLLKDLLGLEMRPDKIVSRRSYGVKGTVTSVTGSGGSTSDYHVIVNDRGIHGAQYGDDGEYTDSYFYDKGIPEGSIVWGGDVGKARTQLNRFDGHVATGNSGLWVGGLNYAVEGDSVEEAVTKLDTQLYKASGRYTRKFTPSGGDATTVITHNLGANPQVVVYDFTTNEVLEVGIVYNSVNQLTLSYSSNTGNDWTVVCETNGAA